MAERVLVIFGGKSAEHDVSIITAHVPIIDSLLALGYDVVPLYISREGAWYTDPSMLTLDYFKNGAHLEKIKSLKPVTLALSPRLTLVESGLFSKQTPIDLVFPAMHGTYGEDGSLMGLLRMANVPFVGCDLAASAVAMDKVLTKQVAEASGVPVVKYVWATKAAWVADPHAVAGQAAHLSYPLFVKPVHLGSSIGISKVQTAAELSTALEVAFHFDTKVLIEEGVEHLLEVTLPIMGNDVLTFACIERPLNKTEFYDFNDKYLGGGKKGSGANSAYSELPATIGAALEAQIYEYAEKTYRALGASGTARIDFLINSTTNDVYMNEVNTLPGSLYHHNWRVKGVSPVELVTRLMTLAKERFLESASVTHAFKSDILSKMKPKGT